MRNDAYALSLSHQKKINKWLHREYELIETIHALSILIPLKSIELKQQIFSVYIVSK